MTTFFDDVRICFELPRQHGAKSPNVMEFSFAGQAVTELGFGGFNATTGKLDLLKLSDRVFDIYFDLASVGVTVIHPEVQYFAYPGMVPEVTFDYSPLNSLQEMFKRGLSYSLTSRNSSFIPRSPGRPEIYPAVSPGHGRVASDIPARPLPRQPVREQGAERQGDGDLSGSRGHRHDEQDNGRSHQGACVAVVRLRLGPVTNLSAAAWICAVAMLDEQQPPGHSAGRP